MFINGLVNIIDNMNMHTAEKQPIESERPKETPRIGLERVKSDVIDMLTENTGASILDSGDHYGRAWQRNRKIKDFDTIPYQELSIYRDTERVEIDININIYPFLISLLEVDEDTISLRKKFALFCMRKDQHDKSWSETIKDFLDEYDLFSDNEISHNSYEDETNELSQIIQFYSFTYNMDGYVFLQIHGGCDIRGGYTDPVIFKVNWEDLICCSSISRDTGFSFVCPDCGESWIETDYDHIFLKKEYNKIKKDLSLFLKEQITLDKTEVNKEEIKKEFKNKLENGKNIESKNDVPYHKGCKNPLTWGYY